MESLSSTGKKIDCFSFRSKEEDEGWIQWNVGDYCDDGTTVRWENRISSRSGTFAV